MEPIRAEAHYDRLVELMNSLLEAGAGEASHPLAGLLYLVGEAVYAWDQIHYPLPPANAEGMLGFLMEQQGLGPSDLPELGSQEDVSEILAGQRRLDLPQIKALAERFGVSAAVFVD